VGNGDTRFVWLQRGKRGRNHDVETNQKNIIWSDDNTRGKKKNSSTKKPIDNSIIRKRDQTQGNRKPGEHWKGGNWEKTIFKYSPRISDVKKDHSRRKARLQNEGGRVKKQRIDAAEEKEKKMSR